MFGKFFGKKKPKQIEVEQVEYRAIGGMSEIGAMNAAAVVWSGGGKSEAVVVDWGEKIPHTDRLVEENGNAKTGRARPEGHSPDINKLGGLKVQVLCLTHGHQDHIGAVDEFYKKNPDVPWMGSATTLNIAYRNLRKAGIRTFPKRVEEETFVFGRFRIKRFAVNHNISGACGFLVEVLGDSKVIARIVVTGDCKRWIPHRKKIGKGEQNGDNGNAEKTEIVDKNINVFRALVKDGQIDLVAMDSTNSEKLGEQISEDRVSARIQNIMLGEPDRMEDAMSNIPGRVFVALLPNVQRAQLIIQKANELNRNVYVVGNLGWMLHEERVSGWFGLEVKKDAGTEKFYLGLARSDDDEKFELPGNAVILCNGALAEPGSFLDKISEDILDLPRKPGDILLISQSIISRKDVIERFPIMGARLSLRFERIYLSRGTPHIERARGGAIIVRYADLHTPGHGAQEFKKMLFDLFTFTTEDGAKRPPTIIPNHGDPAIREILAGLVRDWGGKAILLNDGEGYIL